MKLLILTQYFPPETGAPQNRLFELALRLLKSGVEVTVLTAMPNYPQMRIQEAYRGKKYVYEEMQGLHVHRTAIYVSQKKSVISRLRNYFSFVISSALAADRLEKNYDFLLCESPPLFLGYSAMYLSRRKNAGLIFNVSDLWPESAEKLGVVSNSLLLGMAYRLEEKLYRRSVLVTGQTQGICANINARFPDVRTYWLPNGVDLSYYDPAVVNAGDWRTKHGFNKTDVILMYAGILGIAQGLEIILNAAVAFKNNPALKFVLMGSGPEKEMLLDLKESLDLENVFFLPPVSKIEMPVVLKNIDAAIVPLKKLDIFLGAIPSKIFENLAMEVPILLGVDGEARKLFIHEGKCGIYFEPGNTEELIKAVEQLVADPAGARAMGANGREFVNRAFNRENIAKDFYDRLRSLMK